MYECAQSAITPNNLNLPVYDLHEREARDQILMNFHTLAQTTATISERHLKKCSEQRERIQAIRQRVLKCKQKMQTLSGLNQAIVFVSPAQYPKKYEFDIEQKKSRFSEFLAYTQVHKMDMNAQYIVKHDIKELGQEAKLKIKDLQEFVLYMFGRLKGKRKTVFEKGISNKKEIQSLGKIPTTIRYVDSLTVFNTHINPYRKYEVAVAPIIRENGQASKKKKVTEVEPLIVPQTITNFKKDQYEIDVNMFRPQEKQAEDILFEENLELDGVVSLSQTFNNDTTNMGLAKKKTVVKDKVQNQEKKATQSTISSANSEATQNTHYQSQISTTQYSNAPQNNLPPPPPPLISSFSAPPSLPPPPPPMSLPPPPPPLGLMPPPPPPPPPPAMGLPPPPPPLSFGPPPSLPAPASGSRSALLQQIQNPNHMKRLRKTVTKEYGGVSGLQHSNSTPSSGQVQRDGGAEGTAPGPPKPMSMLDALKQRIKRRYDIIHQEEQQDERGEI